ncbi:hypothetical protein [Methylobacterium nonmethylotrophicum]|uniref:Uncharacterized protein n=1 Tax=Methylobacterium nonmethylotrophicum TaxID=1141884 RepID=A0A4Z0NCT3_9HYPH|nr:hypothetical protein [Methylobacterium nonmethylotrophicum]TGD92488.1 hypothetical protein EU555_34635 [Methylobacterium nonmethylotrophicum]
MNFMIRSIFVTASALVVATASIAATVDSLPAFLKGTSYASARSRLIALDWKPAKTPDAQPCGGDSRCIGRPELEACAGTGAANCIFTWRRGGTLIAVSTAGERDPVVSGITCRSGCDQAPTPQAKPADLTAEYCRSPQAAQAVLAQANRERVLQPPLVATQAKFIGYDRIQGTDMCQFSLSTRGGTAYTFAASRRADGALRLQFAD